MEPDEFTDEICLAVVTERGVTMVVGCAHPGICNMVRHVQTVTGRPVIRLVGGLHLNKAEPARLEATAQVMAGWPQLTCLGLNHCTGQAAETRLAQGRQAGIPQGEAGADALVQKIPGKHQVNVRLPLSRLLQQDFQGQLLHPALRLFPGGLAEIGILVGIVEVGP